MRLWPLLLLAACSPSKENKAICQQAGDRYLSCVGEMLGPEMKAMAASKDGTNACARDDKTVAMYKKCLPSSTCEAFMDCMTDYASNTQPAIASDKPRTEQCAQHVEQGMRGIANQIMMLAEQQPRSESAKGKIQECLFDESRRWDDCVTPAEIAEAKRYAVQRQADCEAWEPALAACVLEQPGAKDCNEDEFPLWDLPVELGAAGPAVAWTSTIADADDYGDDAQLTWDANKMLIVRDDTGLRALRGGAAAWQRPLTEMDYEFAIAGNWIVIRDKGELRGMAVFNADTGEQLGHALPSVPLERHGAAGDKIFVQTDDDELYELNPAKCKSTDAQARAWAEGARAAKSAADYGEPPPKSAKKSATGAKGCATRLGQLVSDDTVYATSITAWRDLVLMTSSTGIHLADRKAVTRVALALDDADAIVPTEAGAAVIYSSRIEMLSFAGCERGDDCVSAKHKVSWVNSIDPTALPGGAIAYNDHGISEKTALLDVSGKGWSRETNARGKVAGDRDFVYTVSFGRNAKEPTHLLALRRADGKAAWHTELKGAAFDASDIDLVLRDEMIAVRIGDKLYAIELVEQT